MARSKNWWWGLPLLALLWLAALWITTPEVEQDLQTRVGSATDSAPIVVAGRDVTLPNATSQNRNAADQTYGVRQVIGTLADQPVTPPDSDIGRPSEVVPPAPAEPAAPAVDESQANPPSSTGVIDAKACEQQFDAALNQYKVLFDTAQDILSHWWPRPNSVLTSSLKSMATPTIPAMPPSTWDCPSAGPKPWSVIWPNMASPRNT